MDNIKTWTGLSVEESVRMTDGRDKWRKSMVWRDGGREFQSLGAATLKLRVPNDVRTNGTERRLVLESLRERVE